jgi:hypothetical protein
MNYPIGRSRNGNTYQKAPLYFDAVWDWYQGLTEDQQDYLTYVIDAFTNWGDEHAKKWAPRLPPAPRSPL